MDNIGNYLKCDFFKNTLEEKRLLYFSLFDLERVFLSHKTALGKFLNRKTAEKKLLRLKRNLYCLSDKIPNDYLLANVLYHPSYLSMEFALFFYSLIPEAAYSITSITAKPTREFEVVGKSFSYQTIKKEAFCGYQPQKIESTTFLIATPEKALADFLYFVSLGKKKVNDRTDWKKVNINIVRNYLKNVFKIKEAMISKLLPK